MNKPTPFGKTYLEYQESLEKFSNVQKIELGLVDEVDKLLNKAGKVVSAANKNLISANNSLLDATIPVNSARIKIGEALKMAEELGSKDAIKLFKNRKEEADYYDDIIDSAHKKVQQGINELP